jgi:hypothetical protein
MQKKYKPRKDGFRVFRAFRGSEKILQVLLEIQYKSII